MHAPEPLSDAELLRRCRADAPGAWAELVDRYGPMVLAAIRTRLGRLPQTDPHHAEERFQEFWAALMEGHGAALATADPARPLGPYLVAAALNLCRRHLSCEARRRHLSWEDVASPVDPGPDPAAALGLREEAASLREALAALPARDRLILTLVELEGLPQTLVAETLGVAPGSVSTLLARSLRRLRKIVIPPVGSGRPADYPQA